MEIAAAMVDVSAVLTINCVVIVIDPEIDIVIERASELIGMAINKALQPDISVDEMMMIVGN